MPPDVGRPDLPPDDRAAARKPRSGRDLSAVPSFLRDRNADGAARTGDLTAGRQRSPGPDKGLAIPRPVTPTPIQHSPATPALDPASLPMPSLSRRRVVTAAGVLLASLLALTFVRQVGEAATATARAAELRAANAALRDDVARLERDLSRVQDPRFIELQGRAFGLGARREIPFALAAGAPTLAPDAPGSASVRLGSTTTAETPLDAWLEVLFGEGA